MESLRSSAALHSAGSAALQRGSSGVGPSHRVIVHPRCSARAGADAQSRSGRAPDPVRAATIEAPNVNVSEGRQAAKQGDIREQAHRRGTHHQIYTSAPTMTVSAKCLARKRSHVLGHILLRRQGFAHGRMPIRPNSFGSSHLKLYAVCAAPLHKGHLFQAKYVPFKAVMEGDPWKSEESYSLDEVIYR